MSQPAASDTPQDSVLARRFVCATLLSAALLSVAAAGFTWAVDPTGRFGTRLVPPVVDTRRDDKVELYLRRPARPACLILGSSQVLQVHPSVVEAATGLSTFNFGVELLSEADLEAILAFVDASGGGAPTLKRVVLGIDAKMFAQKVPKVLDAPRLLPYATPDVRRLWWSQLSTSLLGWEGLSAAWRSLQKHRHGDPPPTSHMDADGYVTWTAFEQRRLAPTFDLEKEIRASAEMVRPFLRAWTKLDADTVGRFEVLLRALARRGVVIDAFLTPNHPLFTKLVEDTPWSARNGEAEAVLRALEHEGVVRFHDVGELESFGGDADDFRDGMHLREDSSTKLVRSVVGE